MALIRWHDPVDTLPSFSSSFPGLFNSVFGDAGSVHDSVPSVNIREKNNSYILEVAAPGMAKDAFDVEVNDNVLTISGSAEENKEEKGDDEKWTRREFSYSSFQRSFQLPKSVESDKIAAEYKDGVLCINVPKRSEEKVKEGKRIKVN